jgi:hypothetical protein
MKGSPLIRALVTLTVLLLFGIPVRWVMRAGAVDSSGGSGRERIESGVGGGERLAAASDRLQVDSTADLKRMVLKHAGAELLRLEGGVRTGSVELSVPSGEGADLSVEVEWVGAGAAAVRVRRVPGDGAAPVDRFVWGMGGAVVEEVLVYPEG